MQRKLLLIIFPSRYAFGPGFKIIIKLMNNNDADSKCHILTGKCEAKVSIVNMYLKKWKINWQIESKWM